RRGSEQESQRTDEHGPKRIEGARPGSRLGQGNVRSRGLLERGGWGRGRNVPFGAAGEGGQRDGRDGCGGHGTTPCVVDRERRKLVRRPRSCHCKPAQGRNKAPGGFRAAASSTLGDRPFQRPRPIGPGFPTPSRFSPSREPLASEGPQSLLAQPFSR